VSSAIPIAQLKPFGRQFKLKRYGTDIGASGNDSTYFLAWFAVPLNN